MVANKKYYLGMLGNPILAALIYDIAIIQTKGAQARPNFAYSKHQLLAILFQNSLIDIKNSLSENKKEIHLNELITTDREIVAKGKVNKRKRSKC